MVRKFSRYTDPDSGNDTITRTAFKRMGKEKQAEVAERWFRERYEDPANRTPYESAEGGYIWIYGGPFEAEEVLREEFEGVIKEDVLSDLVENLQGECWDWTHTSRYDDYPDEFYEVDAALADRPALEILKEDLSLLKKLLKKKAALSSNMQDFQLRMIFCFCITTLEAYLSDRFIKAVLLHEPLKEKYVNAEDRIKGFKKTAGDMYLAYKDKQKSKVLLGEIEKHIKHTLQETSFHNVDKVRKLFAVVFGIDLEKISDLAALVKKRHDFIHRGGRDVDGNVVQVTKDEVELLVKEIELICTDTDKKIEAAIDRLLPF